MGYEVDGRCTGAEELPAAPTKSSVASSLQFLLFPSFCSASAVKAVWAVVYFWVLSHVNAA